MTDTLATEGLTNTAPETVRTAVVLETWGGNERMRHVPTADWIITKLDGDVRRRLGLLLDPLERVPHDDPRHAAAETELRLMCRALDRIAELARHERVNGHSSAVTRERVIQVLDHAIANLRTVDGDLFGRRFPFQTLDRSKAEPLYGALLSALRHLDVLTQAVRLIDPSIDERLLEGLVKLETPLRREPIVIP